MSKDRGFEIPESFEERIERLEEIVEALEAGEAPLEESLKQFEEGIALARACQGQLEAARERVTVLLDSAEDDPSGRDASAEDAEG